MHQIFPGPLAGMQAAKAKMIQHRPQPDPDHTQACRQRMRSAAGSQIALKQTMKPFLERILGSAWGQWKIHGK